MNKELVFLGDLSHTGRGYSSEYIPLGIGCIKAYLTHRSRFANRFEAKIFKNPQKFIDSYLKERPGLVGLSAYCWNVDLAISLAKEIKNFAPDTLLVFGGPDFPIEDDQKEKWLQKNSFIDLFIMGDGEVPFRDVCDFWFEEQDVEALKRKIISGCHSLVGGKLNRGDGKIPRLTDLNEISSPYLLGYFDEFLDQESAVPLMETTRGCPFTCTFCEKGVHDWAKVARKSTQLFEDELLYVAKKYKGKILALADDNFGMYRQDLEFARVIAKVREQWDYPYHINAAAGKNRQETILQTAKTLGGAWQVGASVQSLDPEVLENIRRENISIDVLVKTAQEAHSSHINTRSEVILALPGDSKEKHLKTLFSLVDAGIKEILVFTLILLQGTELGTSEQRKVWGMRTKYRLNFGCFGVYRFGEKKIISGEIEEVCVGNHSMPFEDYLECRSFFLTLGIFYADNILLELERFLENFQIKPSQFLNRVHENRKKFSPPLVRFYQEYEKATCEELWNQREELVHYLKKDTQTIEKILAGELGFNVIYTFRARALVSLVQEIMDEAFKVAKEILKETVNGAFEKYEPYLEELKTFCVLRKKNIFDYEKRYSEAFSYDFEALANLDFRGFPKKHHGPLFIEFFTDHDQIQMMKVHGTDSQGIPKILSRWDVGRLQRKLKCSSAA